jgi:hypothetical protein
MHKTIFLLGAGFTKAARPSAPTNAELVSTLISHSGNTSSLQKYQKLYGTDDMEILLTRLDMDTASDEHKRLDRLAIEAELVSYFSSLRFTTASLSVTPWLGTFATELLKRDEAIITLNYDCFLEGLLDHCNVWTPNGGYYGVDNILVEAEPNPNGIVIYKIHGSEHFRVSAVTDRPEQDAIAYEFDETIFPVSAAHSHFGGGIGARPYVIAPSFVKLPHRQIAMMMLKVLEFANRAHNLVIIGCGLRREDSFLWLLLSRFLARRDKKHLIIVDPAATSISDRIYQYWIGDLQKYTQVSLLSCGVESSLVMLSSALKNE